MTKTDNDFVNYNNTNKLFYRVKKITSKKERYAKFVSFLRYLEDIQEGFELEQKVVSELCTNYTYLQSKAKEKDIDITEIIYNAYEYITTHYPDFSIEILSMCIESDPDVGIHADLLGVAVQFSTVEKFLEENHGISLQEVEDSEEVEESAEEEETPKPKTAGKKVKKPLDLNKVRKTLKEKIKGQDDIIEKILDKLAVIAAGLKDSTNFYFLGKTGGGKTLTAKVLAECVFGDENRLLHVDCASFKHKHNDARIFGSPPGYIGYGEKTIFSKAANKSSAWIVLFDEFEKAGPEFQDICLRLLDEGKLVGSNGEELDFSNSIFIFTSNVGTDKVGVTKIGLTDVIDTHDQIVDQFKEELKKEFKPEFINRLREILVFKDLGEDTIKDIIHYQLNKLPIISNARLVNYILKEINFREYGAREVDKKIESLVEPILAKEMLKLSEIKRQTTKFKPRFTKGNLSFVREKSKSS